MTVAGQDWSSYQPANPATGGLSFVFIKATEGTTYISSDMVAQASHARAAGLVVGFYHFLRPGDMQDQATYFVEKCASVDGDVLAADWEDPGVSCADKDAFLAAVKKLRPNHRVVLYCNLDYWKNRDTTSDCGDGLWIADYDHLAGHPDVDHPWTFHQYDSTPIDKDVANFTTVAALREWANPTVSSKPVTKPATKPKVSLKNVIAAAKADPKAKQGHGLHPADVKPVEAALKAEKLLAAKYASDGAFGSMTVTAYGKWQERCGYRGADANGIPGETSLKKLGAKHGFTVVA